MNVRTSWSKATTDPNIAVADLIACLQSGLNAWIEVQKNGEQEFPIMRVNPELDDPFNWTSLYGAYQKLDPEITYLNDMEKELTLYWMQAFGTNKAVRAYKEDGSITQGLIEGGGVSFPVRIKDAQEYRDTYKKDGYCYQYPSFNRPVWMNRWKPKEGVPTYVPDPDIKEVFVICYNCEEPCLKDNLLRASEFLKKCADYGLKDMVKAGEPEETSLKIVGPEKGDILESPLCVYEDSTRSAVVYGTGQDFQVESCISAENNSFYCQQVESFLPDIYAGRMLIPGNYCWGIASLEEGDWCLELNIASKDDEDENSPITLDYFLLHRDEEHSEWEQIGYADAEKYPVSVDFTKDGWKETLEADMRKKLTDMIAEEEKKHVAERM